MNDFFCKRTNKLNIYLKHGLTLLFIVLMLSAFSSVSAKTVTLANLDYQGEDLVVETGNLTLQFHNSTNKNHSDVTILKLNYIPAYDLTVFKITSEDILYDYNFVNNTKIYVFNSTDVNNTNVYLVKVNYSSIHVPDSPWEYYIGLLEQKNETIRQLMSNLTNTTNNASNFNVSLKNAMERIEALEAYKSQTEGIVEERDQLEEENRNLTVEIAAKVAKVSSLTEEKAALQKTVDSVTPLSYTISKEGKDEIYLNGPSFLLGGVIFLLLFAFFTSKKTAAIRNKSREAATNRFHKREVDIPSVDDMRVERPDVERDMLREVPKEKPPEKKQNLPQEEVSKRVDDILNKKW
jgi:hypothetical protein